MGWRRGSERVGGGEEEEGWRDSTKWRQCGGGRVETLTKVGDTEKWMGTIGGLCGGDREWRRKK